MIEREGGESKVLINIVLPSISIPREFPSIRKYLIRRLGGPEKPMQIIPSMQYMPQEGLVLRPSVSENLTADNLEERLNSRTL